MYTEDLDYIMVVIQAPLYHVTNDYFCELKSLRRIQAIVLYFIGFSNTFFKGTRLVLKS